MQTDTMPILQIHRDEIEEFCHRWKINELSFFGSIIRDDFGSDSDIDILVDFTEDARWSLFDWVDMIEELKSIFGREIDLVDKSSLHNPFRRHAILNNREVAYESK
jgi:predicted nucleotidyltransferase